MIDVVGGTYNEYCFEPYWKEIFGSGLRAVFTLRSLDPSVKIKYHTFSDSKTSQYLTSLKSTFRDIEYKESGREKEIGFYYDHPLITPRITPRPDTLDFSSKILKAKGENILCYGTIEGRSIIAGKNVVYDPQSPANPIPFSKTGSQAERLIVVINLKEAEKLCNTTNLKQIRAFFLKKEKADGLILKMGPKGAIAYENKISHEIPVHKTDSVWPIGSGDVFSAIFFFHWIHGAKIKHAANIASRGTAIYCDTRGFQFGLEHTRIKPLLIKRVPRKKIYIAGPFFTFAQRWIIGQIRNSLSGMGLKTFSPWHDVGHGLARDVVDLDIKGLNECGVVLAVLDGLDSGTLFEIGYAVSKGIQVIAYVQNESGGSLKMLEGTNCIIVDDLTTAIYKAFWKLAEND